MPNGDEQDTSDAAQPVPDLRPSGRRFAALAATSTLTTISSSALNFLGSLIPAYALGREGKGQVAFLAAIPMMIYNFGNLGFGSALAYRVSRGYTPAPVGAFYSVSGGVYYARARGFRLREVFVPTLADLSLIKRLFSKGDNRASGEGGAP
jgi:hypothetical protein